MEELWILFMCSFLISNKDLNTKECELPLSFFGKKIYREKISDFNILICSNTDDCLLKDINEQIFCIFDGVIFDGNTPIDLYKKYGEKFTEYLDGEYAFVLIDLKKRILIGSSDIFGSRQIYFSADNDSITISTLYSCLEQLNQKAISRIYENCYFVYNMDTYALNFYEIHNFNNEEKKDNISDWEEAFEKSVLKKVKNAKNITLLLSDGMDSGSIACCLQKYNINFNALSVITDSYHPNDIFYWRHGSTENLPHDVAPCKVTDSSMIVDSGKIKKCNCNCFFDYKSTRFNQRLKIFEDEHIKEADIGRNLSCYIARYMKRINSDILLSGHGAIFSDKNINRNLNWTNNMRGCNYDNPITIRQCCGPHQIENRLPLLDKQLFQETLFLNKNIFFNYKQQVQQYLDKHKYPYFLYKDGEKIINIRGLTNLSNYI